MHFISLNAHRKLLTLVGLIFFFLQHLSSAAVTFSNSVFSLTLGDDAKISSAVRTVDNEEYVLERFSDQIEGWQIKELDDGILEANESYALSMTDLGDGRFQLTAVDDPNLIVIVRVTEESRYLKFEIESVSNTGQAGVLDEGDGLYSAWRTFSLVFQMCTEGNNFHFFPLDYMTITNHRRLGIQDIASWHFLEHSQNGGEPMGAIAVYYAETDAAHDDILLDIWGNEASLPIPNRANNNNWDRTAAEAWLNQWKAEFADTSSMFFFMDGRTDLVGDLYQAVDIAANLGVNTLYLFPNVWRGEYEYIPYRQSNAGLNTNIFPNGLSDLLALRQYMEAKGVGLDFHYTAGLIGRLDPAYGASNLHPDLASWGTGTLLNATSVGATSMDVQVPAGFEVATVSPWDTYQYPHYYPYVSDATIGTVDVRVGDELLIRSTMELISENTYRLEGIDGVDSDLIGAEQAHAAGETVTFYYSPWGALIPDPKTPLFTTIAEDYATLLNTADVTEVQYDAQNSHYMPWGLWGYDKFAQTIYEKLDHPVTSGDGLGWVSWAHMEYNFKEVYQVTRPTQINQGGPIELSHPSEAATHLDDANFLWAKTVGLNSPYISVTDGLMGVTLDDVYGHGQWAEYSESRKLWVAARPYFSDEQRTRMVPEIYPLNISGVAPLSHNFADETFRIENGGTDLKVYPTQVMRRDGLDGYWLLNQEQGVISPRQFIQPGDALTVTNPYSAQAPTLELRVLPAMENGAAANINLLPEAFSDITLPTSGDQLVSSSGSAIQISMDNSLSESDYWKAAGADESAYWRGIHLGNRLINMQNARGIALTVEGDGSGAELVFTAGNRDYVVPINFTDTRTIEIPNGEVARFKSGFGFRFDTSKPTDYSAVGNFKLYLGYVPAGTTSSVKVHAIEAMNEDRSIGLVDPVLSLNGTNVSVSGTIPDNCYLTYSGGATASVYDENWNLLNSLDVNGSALQAEAGSNTFSVSTSASGNIWLETRLKVEDTPWVLPVTVARSLAIASAPYPADGSEVDSETIDLNALALSWTSDGTSNALIFGSDYNAVASATSGSDEYKGIQTTNSYNPVSLAPGTTYYWSVDVSDDSQTAYGPVWSFSTSSTLDAATAPSPVDGTVIDPDTTDLDSLVLNWTANGSSNTVSFGTDYDAVASAMDGAPEHKGSQTTNTYDPVSLSPGTTYYWSVDVSDDIQTTHGPIWSFSIAESSIITWDGDAGDGLWTSPANWSGDSMPTDAHDVVIGSSATVSQATAGFSSMEIESGATVSLAELFPIGKTFGISGTLDLDSEAALRPYGSRFSLTSTGSFGSKVNWLDLGSGSSLSFVDGATFQTETQLQLGGDTTIGFVLSENGFNTLQLGRLWDSNGAVAWNNLSFNIDISNYASLHETSITLMDFSSHDDGFGGTFNPSVNLTSGESRLRGTLSFDSENSRLILNLNRFGLNINIAPDDTVQLDFQADSGHTYQIEQSTDLNNWTLLEENISGSGNLLERSYPRNTNSNSKQFFKLTRNPE